MYHVRRQVRLGDWINEKPLAELQVSVPVVVQLLHYFARGDSAFYARVAETHT